MLYGLTEIKGNSNCYNLDVNVQSRVLTYSDSFMITEIVMFMLRILIIIEEGLYFFPPTIFHYSSCIGSV